MKLLYAIKNVETQHRALLERIHTALELRMDWLNDREPESNGMVYDDWSEKVDDLQEILDCVESLLEETDSDTQTELIEEIQSLTDTYQAIHGGLSRLTL